MAAVDTLKEITPMHSITASETSQPFVVLEGPVTGQTFYRSYQVRVQYQDMLLTSGSGTVTFAASISYNKGASWVANANGGALTLSTSPQDGEQTFQVIPNLPTDCGQIWLMVLATVGGSPTGASASYRADLLS